MKKITIDDIVRVSGGKLLYGNPEETVENLSTDSREMPAEALFVPISGESFDGHDFIAKALENGVKAVISAKEAPLHDWAEAHPSDQRNLILVSDTLSAVQKIGAFVRSLLSIRAVGVTGSVGKTTTREMISAALSSQKKVYRTGKNYNNKLGVPITLCEMSDDYDLAVLELGLNVPDELGTISSLTDLSCAVITNIGVAHMEYYGNQDRLTEEKMTVTRGFYPGRKEEHVLFLNGDDPYLMKYKDYSGYPVRIYGTGENAAYRAIDIRPKNGCYSFEFVKDGVPQFRVNLSVPGVHNVLNALAALAVSDYFGLELQKAAASLSEFTGFSGRLQRHEKDGIVYIDDTYNASPASMKAGLRVLSEMTPEQGGRRIAVLGDMLELGADSKKFHYEVGQEMLSMLPQALFLYGEEAQEIGKAVRDGAGDCEIHTAPDLSALKDSITAFAKPGDIVYFKASHGMHFSPLLADILK